MQSLDVLLVTAATIGGVHTLIGVDHSLPFVVLGRAQGWGLAKVLRLTAICGVGHVLSSVVLGGVGLAVGAAVGQLEWIESMRGALAAWLLIGFGVAYVAWAMVRKARGKRHVHVHHHADGRAHSHVHDHNGDHLHPHLASKRRMITAWSLFIVFVLGPCEPLIPLLMVPALKLGFGAAALVALVFGVVTLATMLATVTVAYLGLSIRRFDGLTAHADVLAGLAIILSGVGIQVLGL